MKLRVGYYSFIIPLLFLYYSINLCLGLWPKAD
jgi:hypothetical protein